MERYGHGAPRVIGMNQDVMAADNPIDDKSRSP